VKIFIDRIFRKILLVFFFFILGFVYLHAQVAHPDLELNGRITWLSDTRIRVEYDWTDDSQLKDWIPTNGSDLVRGNGSVTLRGGVASVHSMVWKQYIRCSRISAEGAKAVNSSNAHLNFITNVAGWNGYNFNPPEIIGVIYKATGNLFTENANSYSLGSPNISLGANYNIDVNISETTVTTRSSSDNIVYSHNLSSPPDPDRQVAIGGWGGDTEWGKVIIEGEIDILWQTPSDMIDIITAGASFNPVIELEGNAVVEWIFDDGTTSSSSTPDKNYGSPGVRHNLLKITPWSALVGLNLGYDGMDGGYGDFAMVDKQNVLEINNLTLAGSSLKYICAAYSPLSELDLREFPDLEFIELLACQNLSSVLLGTHNNLERLCVEDCNLSDLNISGCPVLMDFRAALNRFPAIVWGASGSELWHICVRSNPQFEADIPAMTQFPLLQELLIWDCNQTGNFECHSSVIKRISASDNKYSDVDLTGCTGLLTLELSGNILTQLDIGAASSLGDVDFSNCSLSQSLTDYVLQTIDGAGLSNGVLDLAGNSAPSASGMVHYNNLRSRGWTVTITDPGQVIPVTSVIISGAQGQSSINVPGGTLQVSAQVLPANATDRSITWTITSGLGNASISTDGLVTAIYDGTITVRGTSNDGSGIFGEMTVLISNQESIPDGGYTQIGNIIVSTSELRVLLNDDYNSWRASLFNFGGRLVSNRYVDSNILIFDVSALSPGIYLIVLSKNDLIATARFYKP
jgi:hypothetical protein